MCGCYLFVLYGLAKHDVANVSTTPFNTEGALWYAGVRQTIAALGFALALNGGVIALNGGLWQALCCLPLGLVWHKYYAAAERRYATRSLHGLSKGRLPLRDASDVDAARDPAATEALLARLCDEDMYFSAPESLPPRDHAAFEGALPGPPVGPTTDCAARLEAIDDWLQRHDRLADEFLAAVAAPDAAATVAAVAPKAPKHRHFAHHHHYRHPGKHAPSPRWPRREAPAPPETSPLPAEEARRLDLDAATPRRTVSCASEWGLWPCTSGAQNA